MGVGVAEIRQKRLIYGVLLSNAFELEIPLEE